MKLSIVIPAYNEENSIATTLKAVLAQDYHNFEVIVVDNASTDRTSHIAKQFKGVIVVREDRKGLLHAREAGRRAATGDIIVNIDADCVPHPTWLSRGVVHFEADHVVAVTGPYYYHDAKFGFRFFSINFQRVMYSVFNQALQMFNKGAVLIGGNNFIRASALNKIGGYNTSITFYGEDTDTAKRVSQIGRVLFLNKQIMPTSARRFYEEGKFRTGYLYIMNFFWVIFFKKPYSRVKLTNKNLLFTNKKF